MRPPAEGKKLFLWHEVLVLMDRSLLPEGSGSKSLSGMGEVSCNLACTPQGPGGVQILETWEVTFSAE